MNHCRRLLLCLCVCLFTACSDDESVLPSFRQDLADLHTGLDGKATSLTPDNGVALRIANADEWKGLSADTIYRVLALYVAEADGKVRVQQLSHVFSQVPLTLSEDSMRRDPLDLEAAWRGGRYVSLLVSWLSAGNGHGMAFINKGVSARPDGGKVLRLELYHDRRGDAQYYYRQAYLSCPLSPFEGVLLPGRDSVELRVTTRSGPVVR